MDEIAVLLMAYGTPGNLDEVEAYYTDIRGGRKPSPELLQELEARYARIGGRTPLLEITMAQAQALQAELGHGYRVYVGMKHWHPFLAEAVADIRRGGHTRAIAVAMAPHYSRFSMEGYRQRVAAAMADLGASFDIHFVESWNDHPLLIASIAERMQDTLPGFGISSWGDVHVIFSAHSLPERIVAAGDPYPAELKETCELVAARLALAARGWRFAYQSAGRTGEKWLGPDILETLDRVAGEGYRRVLIAPVGFVADHLEILYDIDVDCANRARLLGIEMQRIPSANATTTFIHAVAEVVRVNATAA